MNVCPYLETCKQKIRVQSSRLCFGEGMADMLQFNFRMCNIYTTQHRVNDNSKDKGIRKTPSEWAKGTKGLKEQVRFT